MFKVDNTCLDENSYPVRDFRYVLKYTRHKTKTLRCMRFPEWPSVVQYNLDANQTVYI